MADRIVLNLRDLAKGEKSKDDFEQPFMGARRDVVFKASDSSSPLELEIFVDPTVKDPMKAILGVELRGELLPIRITTVSETKRAFLRSMYHQGRYAVIGAIRLLTPGK
jgi:hypothetical protein